MYGFPYAGNKENKILQKRLVTCGFIPTPFTPDLCQYDTIPIQLALMMDDFGV